MVVNDTEFKATEDVLKYEAIGDHKIKVYFNTEMKALNFDDTESLLPISCEE